MKGKLLLWILMFPAVMATAQTVPYTFKHYTTASGLLSNQVFSTVQDDEGYLWIGGTDGLQRFDGTRYLSFRHEENNPATLPANPVMQLLIDHRNRLWVLLFDGSVGIFDRKKFVFSRKKLSPESPSSLQATASQLITDGEGNIFYLLQGAEYLTWNEQGQVFSYANNFISLPAGWHVSGFAPQPGSRKYYLGIQGVGIAIYDRQTSQLSYPGNNTGNEAIIRGLDKSIFPADMLFDKKGRLWFYYWLKDFPTIFCYNLASGTYQKYELLSRLNAYHEVRGFFEQSDGSIWLRGANVFARFNENAHQFEIIESKKAREHHIAYENISSLYEDRSGRVWIGTNSDGLYNFSPSKSYFSNIGHENRRNNKPGMGSPMSFIHTRWNTILVGTWEDGLYHYDSAVNPIPLHIKGIDENAGPFVWSMFASADSNTIWMSAQPGLYKLDQNRRSVVFYNPPALQGRTVRQVVEDKKGNVWLGMHNGGLFKWVPGKNKDLSKTSPERFSLPPTATITKLIVDNRGFIWAASSRHGVYAINPENGEIAWHFGKSVSGNKPGEIAIPEDAASGLLEYNDSNMLISLDHYLLVFNRYSGQLTVKYGSDAFSGNITALQKDATGYIWLTSTSGLYRVSLLNKVLLRFTKEDGLENESFITASSAGLRDGRLIFGNTNQFVLFSPSRISVNHSLPTIRITGFDLMNKPLNVDSLLGKGLISLKYNQNSVSVFFSTMSFDNEYLIQYKLEGLDNKWMSADDRQQAIYTYLPPGNYDLKFRYIDMEGRLYDINNHLAIHVSSPFWKTWWFYSILVLLLASILFLLDRERAKRKAAVERMRNNIATNLHKDINTALRNINILSEMARQKADNEPVKSKEFIEQIHSKSHNMIIAMDDMLWSLAPENDSMLKTINRMQEYIDSLNARYQADICLLVEEKIRGLNLDMQYRHEAFRLFKDIIKGLVQAGMKKAGIQLVLEKNQLLYAIHFDGDCCDSHLLNNLFQRQDLHKRLEIIKGGLQVQVNRKQASVEMNIPVS